MTYLYLQVTFLTYNFPRTHSHNSVDLLEKIIRCPGREKNVINYHLLNPVHTSLNDIDWPRKGREKDNVKIKRAVSYMPYAQHI